MLAKNPGRVIQGPGIERGDQSHHESPLPVQRRSPQAKANLPWTYIEARTAVSGKKNAPRCPSPFLAQTTWWCPDDVAADCRKGRIPTRSEPGLPELASVVETASGRDLHGPSTMGTDGGPNHAHMTALSDDRRERKEEGKPQNKITGSFRTKSQVIFVY